MRESNGKAGAGMIGCHDNGLQRIKLKSMRRAPLVRRYVRYGSGTEQAIKTVRAVGRCRGVCADGARQHRSGVRGVQEFCLMLLIIYNLERMTTRCLVL